MCKALLRLHQRQGPRRIYKAFPRLRRRQGLEEVSTKGRGCTTAGVHAIRASRLTCTCHRRFFGYTDDKNQRAPGTAGSTQGKASVANHFIFPSFGTLARVHCRRHRHRRQRRPQTRGRSRTLWLHILGLPQVHRSGEHRLGAAPGVPDKAGYTRQGICGRLLCLTIPGALSGRTPAPECRACARCE